MAPEQADVEAEGQAMDELVEALVERMPCEAKFPPVETAVGVDDHRLRDRDGFTVHARVGTDADRDPATARRSLK